MPFESRSDSYISKRIDDCGSAQSWTTAAACSRCTDYLSICTWSVARRTLLLLLTVIFLSACYEEGMTVSLNGRTPPSFNLSGSGDLVFFTVSEVAAENQNLLPAQRDGDKNTLLWRIRPSGLSSEAKRISRLPQITYGVVPAGFEQNNPAEGPPPPLVEGKLYQAGGPATNANGGFVWFKIEGTKVVRVDAPGGN